MKHISEVLKEFLKRIDNERDRKNQNLGKHKDRNC